MDFFFGLIEQELDDHVLRIDGQTERRHEIVRQFQTIRKAPVF